MKIYWSQSTQSFYDSRVNRVIPDDAVEITANYRDELMAGMLLQKTVLANKEGYPVLTAPRAPTPQRMAGVEREWRTGEFERIKWLRERHSDEQELEVATTLNSAQFRELLIYLQQMRDWPLSPDFPNAEQRPAPPAWISEQTR